MRRLRDIAGSRTELVEVDLERPRPKLPQLFRDYLTRKLHFRLPAERIAHPRKPARRTEPQGGRQVVLAHGYPVPIDAARR